MDPFEEIKQTFFQECDEQLADLEAGLLALQEGAGDADTINAVFRAVHSMKGGAGAFGMEALASEPDLLVLGEMGIGNTTPAAAIYHALYGGQAEDWVGRGTGVDDGGLRRKADAVRAAVALHKPHLDDPLVRHGLPAAQRPRAGAGPTPRAAQRQCAVSAPALP